MSISASITAPRPSWSLAERYTGSQCGRCLYLRDGPCVALAIIHRAKVRAALDYLPGNLHVRHCWIETSLARAAMRVHDSATHPPQFFVVLIPIRCPLPHISNHVVQAVPIWRERPHCRGTPVSIYI